MMSEGAQALLRFGVFALTLSAMLAAEAAWPSRPRLQRRAHRWFTNLGLVLLGNAAVRLLVVLPAPLVAAAAALWAGQHYFGLFNIIGSPVWLSIVGSLLILDLAVWTQHLCFHHFPLLWRLHAVHHADRDLDATSALRFHPLEIALSMLIKSAVVVVVGAPVVAVVAFELLLNACAIFNHANISLPARVERMVRPLLVTPDLHRVHHSVRPREHNSNFGFCLSVWDWLFATMLAPKLGVRSPDEIGLLETQAQHPERLVWVLVSPFQPRRAARASGEADNDSAS